MDLFPTVVSAVDGKLGYAPQAWFGIDHTRLRIVFAHLEPPDAFLAPDHRAPSRSSEASGPVRY